MHTEWLRLLPVFLTAAAATTSYSVVPTGVPDTCASVTSANPSASLNCVPFLYMRLHPTVTGIPGQGPESTRPTGHSFSKRGYEPPSLATGVPTERPVCYSTIEGHFSTSVGSNGEPAITPIGPVIFPCYLHGGNSDNAKNKRTYNWPTPSPSAPPILPD